MLRENLAESVQKASVGHCEPHGGLGKTHTAIRCCEKKYNLLSISSVRKLGMLNTSRGRLQRKAPNVRFGHIHFDSNKFSTCYLARRFGAFSSQLCRISAVRLCNQKFITNEIDEKFPCLYKPFVSFHLKLMAFSRVHCHAHIHIAHLVHLVHPVQAPHLLTTQHPVPTVSCIINNHYCQRRFETCTIKGSGSCLNLFPRFLLCFFFRLSPSSCIFETCSVLIFAFPSHRLRARVVIRHTAVAPMCHG